MSDGLRERGSGCDGVERESEAGLPGKTLHAFDTPEGICQATQGAEKMMGEI